MTGSMENGGTMPGAEAKDLGKEMKDAGPEAFERTGTAQELAEAKDKEIRAAVAEAEKVVNPIGETSPGIGPDLAALKAQADGELAANAEAMRQVAEDAKREAGAVIDVMGKTGDMAMDKTYQPPIGEAGTQPGMGPPDVIRLPADQLKAESGRRRMAKAKEGAKPDAKGEDAQVDEGDKAIDMALLLGMTDTMPEEAMKGVIERAGKLTFEDKIDLLLPTLEAKPELAARLGEAGLSEGEKLSLMLRLSRREPVQFLMAMRQRPIELSDQERAAVAMDILQKEPTLAPVVSSELRLSHDAVVEVLKSSPPDVRAEMLRVLKVPDTASAKELNGFSPEEIKWFAEWESDKEWLERYKTVEKANEASRGLMFAIEVAFPERAAAERERFAFEQQMHGMIEKVGELGKEKYQATSPLFVQIEGRDLPAIYKPRTREQQARPGIVEGEMVGREALASFIDRALRLDVVPATVLRDGPEGLGTVQDWKVGQPALKDPEWDAPKHKEQLMRIGLFDWLTQNSDRHMGNWIVSPDGKHQAIDNGALFSERKSKFDGVRSAPLHAVREEPLSDELRKNVEALASSPEVMAALKQGFEATLSKDDAERAWKEFSAKLEEARKPDFKLPDTEWWGFN